MARGLRGVFSISIFAQMNKMIRQICCHKLLYSSTGEYNTTNLQMATIAVLWKLASDKDIFILCRPLNV